MTLKQEICVGPRVSTQPRWVRYLARGRVRVLGCYLMEVEE
jgi:hypothetical protein